MYERRGHPRFYLFSETFGLSDFDDDGDLGIFARTVWEHKDMLKPIISPPAATAASQSEKPKVVAVEPASRKPEEVFQREGKLPRHWIDLVAEGQRRQKLAAMVVVLEKLATEASRGSFRKPEPSPGPWDYFKLLTSYLSNPSRPGFFEKAFKALSVLISQATPTSLSFQSTMPVQHLPPAAGLSYAQPDLNQQSRRPWQQPPPVGDLNRQLSHPWQSHQPPFLSHQQPSQWLDPQFSPADTYKVHDQAGPISSRMNAIEVQLAAICAAMRVVTGSTGMYQ